VATTAERKKLHDLMSLLLAHKDQVHYPRHDVRGAADAATWRITTEAGARRKLNSGGSLMFDCSQSTQQLCRWAGLRDPCGHEYAWAGFTGDMLRYLRHYSDPEAAFVGALVVFGPATGEHVSMVYEPGRDPLLWSQGFEAGPELIRLSAQAARHHKPVTFCSIAKL